MLNITSYHTFPFQVLVASLLILSVTTSAARSRHIRSANDDVNVTLLPSDHNVPPGLSAPPPPSDGGAKTILEPEAGSSGHKREEELETLTLVPHVNVVSNDTLPVPKAAPQGQAGFGGPLAPDSPVKEEEEESLTGDGESGVRDGVGKGLEGIGDGTRTKDGPGRYSCRVCPPGFGVVNSCTAETDTFCAKCPLGAFSEGYSATATCTTCSSCTSGFYQRTPCAADSDVLCGACHSRGNGFGNEDFRRQCEGATIEPTTSVIDGGDDELSTVKDKIPVLPVEPTTAAPIINIGRQDTQEATVTAEVLFVEPHVGEAQAKEKEQVKEVKAGGFQWPILLAALLSGLVFFIIGIIVSMLCKKSAHRQKHDSLKEEYGQNDSVRNTSFFRTDNDYSPKRGASRSENSDVNSPLNSSK